MQSVMFDSLSGPFLNENLLHNRLNFKGYVNDNITFAAELRNRLFTGDMVQARELLFRTDRRGSGMWLICHGIYLKNNPSF